MWIDEEKQDEQQDQQPDSLNSPSVGAGAGGGGPAGGPQVKSSDVKSLGTPSSMTPTEQAPKQQFGTIQDYFKGSKNQGEQLGEQFTNKLTDTANKNKSTVIGAADAAGKEIEGAAVKENPFLTSRAAFDPTGITSDLKNRENFEAQWNAAYQGPNSFEESKSYGDATKAVADSNAKAEQVKSVGGQQQILQDEFGVYGQGNKGLDQALLQESSYYPKVQEKGKEFGGLSSYLKGQGATLAPKVEAAKALTAKTKDTTRNAVTGGINKFTSDIDANVAKAKTSADALLKQAQAGLANPAAISDESLKQLGMTRSEFTSLMEDKNLAAQGYKTSSGAAGTVAPTTVDLQQYLKNQTSQVGRNTVMTAKQLADAKAYAELTGDQNVLPTVGSGVDTRDSFVSFDKNAAKGAVGNAAKQVRDAAQREKDIKLPPEYTQQPGKPPPPPIEATPGWKLVPGTKPGDRPQEVKITPPGTVGTQPIRYVPLPTDNQTPQVNPGVDNPNGIQLKPNGQPIVPEGATGVYKTPDGEWQAITPTTQKGNVINPNPTTVDTKGGTEDLPYIGDKVVKQIQDAVKMRTQPNNPDPTVGPRLKAMGNDLSVLYARKLAGTLSKQDEMKFQQYARELGLSDLVTSAVPTDLKAYVEQNRIAPTAPAQTPQQKSRASMDANIANLTKGKSPNQLKSLTPQIDQFNTLFNEYLQADAKTNPFPSQKWNQMSNLMKTLGLKF